MINIDIDHMTDSWASARGEDEHGAFACFEVGGVEQRMRWIAPGRFMMGSPESEEGRDDDEGPQHEVTLTKGYWLADTPCTQAMWQAVMGSNPSRFQGPRRPVDQVSWDDMHRFLEQLNNQVAGLGAGLPSEAQWEHACRAGTKTATYAELDEVAWYDKNSNGETHDVERKRPNAWGLHDMLGNVYEWCKDGLYDYTDQPETDPIGPRGPRRVFRGGSWYSSARRVRAAYRGWFAPGFRDGLIGFRLVRGWAPRPI
jgi:formylglycine-generating enzyme required for sulfatase activity